MTFYSKTNEMQSIATALGLDSNAKELRMLHTLLGTLNGITTSSLSITIPVPHEIAATDIVSCFRTYRHLHTVTDGDKIVVSRSLVQVLRDTKTSSNDLVMPKRRHGPPPPMQPTLEVSSSATPTDHQFRKERASPVTATRNPVHGPSHNYLTKICDQLNLTAGCIPNYRQAISILQRSREPKVTPARNANASCWIYISVPTPEDAANLLTSIGFQHSRHSSKWADTPRYELSHNEEGTVSKAHFAINSGGNRCDITISVGEASL